MGDQIGKDGILSVFFRRLATILGVTDPDIQLLMVLTAASLASCVGMTQWNTELAYYLLPIRAWEFVVDGLV